MSLPEILLLAVALGVDALTVGAAVGLTHRAPRQIFRLSFHFGLFQALLPLVGIFLGSMLAEVVAAFDHWLSFGLLLLVGGRMVWGALKKDDPDRIRDLTRGWSLILLSIAVSIDALAVGFTLGVSRAPFALPVTLIGLIAAAMTILGMLLGNRVGPRLGKGCEFAAGVVLIGIGVKILVGDLMA